MDIRNILLFLVYCWEHGCVRLLTFFSHAGYIICDSAYRGGRK